MGHGHLYLGERTLMIRVTLTMLIFIYLTGALTAIFGLWLWTQWGRWWRERRSLHHRLRCALCSYEFEDRTKTELPQCPRCGSLTERDKFRSL